MIPLADKELVVPPEPTGERDRFHRVALESPSAWRQVAARGDWIADALWPHWGPVLTQADVSHRRLAEVAAGYQGELWLWLMGERTWAHTASGLAGRVQRRAVPQPPAVPRP